MLLLAQPGLNCFSSKGDTLFSVNEVKQFQCVLNEWLKVKLVVVAVNTSVKTVKTKENNQHLEMSAQDSVSQWWFSLAALQGAA